MTSIFSARSEGSPGSTNRQPSYPSSCSGIPPILEPITSLPLRIDSYTTYGAGSAHMDGTRTALVSEKTVDKSFSETQPRRSTRLSSDAPPDQLASLNPAALILKDSSR